MVTSLRWSSWSIDCSLKCFYLKKGRVVITYSTTSMSTQPLHWHSKSSKRLLLAALAHSLWGTVLFITILVHITAVLIQLFAVTSAKPFMFLFGTNLHQIYLSLTIFCYFFINWILSWFPSMNASSLLAHACTSSFSKFLSTWRNVLLMFLNVFSSQVFHFCILTWIVLVHVDQF